MTTQYQQDNINVPMSFGRRVDQSNVDANLPVPGVPLNEDDEWILALDDASGAYTIFLPDVREVLGQDIVIKSDPSAGLAPTISALQTTTPPQTINGVATFGPPFVGDSITIRADPPDRSTDPATQPSNWSIICVCPSPVDE